MLKCLSFFVVAIAFVVLPVTAKAGFGSWSADETTDPFSGGSSVTLDFMDSERTGALLMCNSDSKLVTVRVVHGWQFQESAAIEHSLKIAVDGKVILDVMAKGVAVGDNIAASDITLNREQSAFLVSSFYDARNSIDFKAEISSGFLHTSASGSTKAATTLLHCIGSQ